MTRLPMSPAGAALFRGLIARLGVQRDRILLSKWSSVDWQSLTFVGECHDIELRVLGPDSSAVATRLIDGLAEAEFEIVGQIVADIRVVGEPTADAEGVTALCLEALTIAD